MNSGAQVYCSRLLVEEIEGAMHDAAPFLDEDLCQGMDKFTGARIIFKNVSVEIGKKKKFILSDISGYMDAATLTGVMGPSGSGKTTLVDVITKRKNTGVLSGTVLYNGKKAREKHLKRKIAYVQQDDHLIENLTVKESLLYNYDLVMGRRTSSAAKRKIVEGILRQLDLERCQHLYIGSQFQRGISGGQRKRTNIGISLLGTPSVIFMDEPTSGLDSHIALEVMCLVKNLAREGLTTVVSIHSPNPSIFCLFDRLIILVDGRMVYFGGCKDEPAAFFRAAGFEKSYHLLRESDADWLTTIVTQASRLKRANQMAELYNQSDLREENERYLEQIYVKDSNESSSFEGHKKQFSSWQNCLSNSGIWATWCILKHRLKADYRMPSYIFPRIGVKILFAVVILTLFWGIGKDLSESASYQEKLSRPISIATSLFMWGILPAFGSVSVIPILFQERSLFFIEKKAGYYNASSYLIAKIVEEIILDIVASTALSCAVWFSLQLRGSWLLFFLVYFTTGTVGVLLAYLFASIAPTPEFAIIFCLGVNIVLIFFVGILIRWVDIPAYWKWIVYINFLHYSWGALMKNQFTDEDILGPFGIPTLEYLSLSSSSSAWDYLGYLTIFVVVYFSMAWAALQHISYARR